MAWFQWASTRYASPAPHAIVMQALLHEANALVVVDDVVRQDVIAVDNLQRLHANLRLARIHQVAQKHEERRDVLLELRIREHTALLQNALPQFQQCHTLPWYFSTTPEMRIITKRHCESMRADTTRSGLRPGTSQMWENTSVEYFS